MSPAAAMPGVLPRRLKAWLGYGAHRLGRWGLAAALTWALGAGLWVWSVQLEHQADTVRRQTLAALQAQARAATPEVLRPRPVGLLQALPGADRVPEFIERLHREAARHGVAVERAEYRAPQTTRPLARLQVVMPAAGRWSAIGRWLAAVLQAHPEAAVDELVLQRDEAGAGLRARVVLSHYSRLPT